MSADVERVAGDIERIVERVAEFGYANDDEWRSDIRAAIAAMQGAGSAEGRLDPDFRAQLIDFAEARIKAVWSDFPDGTTADVLAHNVVSAQEFLWLSLQFPVSHPAPTPDAEVVTVFQCAHCGQGSAAHGTPSSPSFNCVAEMVEVPAVANMMVGAEQVQAATHALSEYLNDNAPIGEATYRGPAIAALKAAGIKVLP